MQRTRWDILQILKKRGKASLEELAKEIGLVPVTVRSHLSVLERDHLVTSEEVRGRVGRPHFVYSLTDNAQELFPKNYHVLAERVLRAILEMDGPEKLERVFQTVSDNWASERAPRMAGKTAEERVQEMAQIRTEEGALAECDRVNGEFMLRQYNCPAIRVAGQQPLVCRAELDYLRKLLGMDVERVSSIATGDGSCNYVIRPTKRPDSGSDKVA